MRDILFRGKRVDDGNWVEGYYAKTSDMFTDETYDIIFRVDVVACLDIDKFDGYRAVHPETVGQFTGLLDKNGVKIFEGDIVKFASGITRSVVFSEWLAEFEFDNHDPVENPDGCCLCCDHEYCEVVGNIWDNPELLKGDTI